LVYRDCRRVPGRCRALSLASYHPTRRANVVPPISCSLVSQRTAYAALQPYLDAVNVAPAPTPRVGKTLSSVVGEWREQIAVNLKPSTVRAAESHSQTAHRSPAWFAPSSGADPKTVAGFRNNAGSHWHYAENH